MTKQSRRAEDGGKNNEKDAKKPCKWLDCFDASKHIFYCVFVTVVCNILFLVLIFTYANIGFLPMPPSPQIVISASLPVDQSLTEGNRAIIEGRLRDTMDMVVEKTRNTLNDAKEELRDHFTHLLTLLALATTLLVVGFSIAQFRREERLKEMEKELQKIFKEASSNADVLEKQTQKLKVPENPSSDNTQQSQSIQTDSASLESKVIAKKTPLQPADTQESDKETTQSLDELIKDANDGDAEAQFNLGRMYYFGNGGVEQDYAKAKHYFELAADQGLAKAQFNLGVMYAKGEGCEQDYVKAIDYYALAAKQDHADAQNSLGSMYANGNGVEQDYIKAKKYYALAATQGDAYAQNNLGLMYTRGDGVAQDHAKAKEYYELAAEQGLADAQNNLGVMYAKGVGGERNYVKAKKYYALAATQGDAKAQCNLGRIFLRGRSVPTDPVQAVKWFRKSADQGNITALYEMMDVLVKGVGTLANPAHAYGYLTVLMALKPSEAELIETKTEWEEKLSAKDLKKGRNFAKKIWQKIEPSSDDEE